MLLKEKKISKDKYDKSDKLQASLVFTKCQIVVGLNNHLGRYGLRYIVYRVTWIENFDIRSQMGGPNPQRDRAHAVQRHTSGSNEGKVWCTGSCIIDTFLNHHFSCQEFKTGL